MCHATKCQKLESPNGSKKSSSIFFFYFVRTRTKENRPTHKTYANDCNLVSIIPLKSPFNKTTTKIFSVCVFFSVSLCVCLLFKLYHILHQSSQTTKCSHYFRLFCICHLTVNMRYALYFVELPERLNIFSYGLLLFFFILVTVQTHS